MPQIACAGRSSAAATRSELIRSHLPLARKEAVRAAKVYRLRHENLEDLEGFAFEGLCAAAAAYDPHRRVPFGAFARYRIRGAVIDGLRLSQWSTGSRSDPTMRYAPQVSLDAANLRDDETGRRQDRPKEVVGGEEPELVLEASWDAEEIAQAVATLPARERYVLHLYFWEGWRMQDIGALMHVTESRVSQIVHHAYQRLRLLVTPVEEDRCRTP